MKKVMILAAIFIIGLKSFANEPIKVVNPDKNTKIEIILYKPAKKFGGNLEIAKGQGDFEVILCDEGGRELKRTKVGEKGEYNFGTTNAGRYYLKLQNNFKKPPEEFIDKAAPNIMDVPYVRDKPKT